jgi:hypothetical protein
LRRNRSRQVVDRPQRLQIGLAEKAAPAVHYLLLKQPRLRQITLRGQGDSELADRL